MRFTKVANHCKFVCIPTFFYILELYEYKYNNSDYDNPCSGYYNNQEGLWLFYKHKQARARQKTSR